MESPLAYSEMHYSSLETQTNIYAVTSIHRTRNNERNKILLSSIDAEFILLEFVSNDNQLKPVTQHLRLGQLAGDAEVISIDFLNQTDVCPFSALGVAYIRPDRANNSTLAGKFFNIYTSWDRSSEHSFEKLTECCQQIELDFTPLFMTHTRYFCNGVWKSVFLLSSGDCKMHLYNADFDKQTFNEEEFSLKRDFYFPEFSNFTSCILWIDVIYMDDGQSRVTALCTQSGEVSLFVTDILKSEVTKCYTTKCDGPITRVLLFTDKNDIAQPEFLPQLVDHERRDSVLQIYHLLVISAVEESCIYRDVLYEGLTCVVPLSGSDKYDVATCACIADVDLDGENEILLGTYGGELMVYKRDDRQRSNSETSSTDNHSPNRKDSLIGTDLYSTRSKRSLSDENVSNCYSAVSLASAANRRSVGKTVPSYSYTLLWQRAFPDPILSLKHEDMTGDGLKELVVSTLKGMHVLQADLEMVSRLYEKRLKLYLGIHQKDADNT